MTGLRECKYSTRRLNIKLTTCSALQVDGFWTHGIGNEGSIRIHDTHEEGP